MYKGKVIGVVVPAYNEERFIARVLTTIPAFVDKIYAVNDDSTDGTLEMINSAAEQNGRITVVNRERKGGVGAAIVSGHKKALEDNVDVIAVMAGDAQMDPVILDRILDPVVEGKADYAKGDRLSNPEYKKEMSAWRAFGNFLLTFLTKIASGYWHISDPQNGYTALSKEVLQRLDLDKIETGFAFENDMLVKLNVAGAQVIDVPHPAKYGKERSKIKYPQFIAGTSWLLLKDFFWRLWVRYIRGNNKQKGDK
jgi:glycosyltransferase involved in cell wall biosynthesis